MGAILGFIFHFIAGFSSGSFYMPYKKVNRRSWETFWIVGGLFSWLIFPPIAAYINIPGFIDIIKNSTSQVLTATFVMGLLWGIGNFIKTIFFKTIILKHQQSKLHQHWFPSYSLLVFLSLSDKKS